MPAAKRKSRKSPIPHPWDVAFEYENAVDLHNVRRLKSLIKKKWPLPQYILRYAYMSHRTDLFPILLAAGADPGYFDDQWTIVSACIVDSDLSTLKLLLKYGADPNIGFRPKRGYVGVPALVLAARVGDVKVLRLLIDAGANLFANPRLAPNALFEAVGRGHKEVVQFLIERGVKFTSRKPYGKTALEFAEEHGQTEILDLLRQHRRRKNSPNKSPHTTRDGSPRSARRPMKSNARQSVHRRAPR